MSASALPYRPKWSPAAIVTLLGVIGTLCLSVALVGYAINSLRAPPAPVTIAIPQNVPALPALAAPDAIKPVTAQDAETQNAARPNDGTFDPPASPFVLPRQDVARWNTAVDCLTAAVYYESASEPVDGQRAVAQVVLNRLRHPAFPKSVCGVVYDGWQQPFRCQFSFACDGSLKRKPSAGGWNLARAVAVSALSGYVMPGVGHATHYHANYVLPYWADQLAKVGTVGRHIFYRWPGFWGTAAAFRKPYAGIEANPMIEAQTAVPTLDVPADVLADVKPTLAYTGARPSPLNVDRAPKPSLLADQQKGTLAVGSSTLIEKDKSQLVVGPSTTN